MPDGAVYVGRPGIYGNPFPVEGDWITWAAVAIGFQGNLQGRRQAALVLYRAWMTHTPPTVKVARQDLWTIAFVGKEIGTGEYVQGLAGRFCALFEPPTLPERPDLSELRGKDLACWCPLDQPCHADVLLELANREEKP
jgi:hypothetical protein